MDKSLSVLQVIDSLAVGGAEMMAVNIANGLDRQGVSSHICVTRKEGLLKKKLEDHIGYLYLNKKTAIDLNALLRLRRYIKENSISVIHVHSTSVFFCFFLILLGDKNSYIWHNHTGANINKKGGIKFLILKWILKFYKSIINVSMELNNWTCQFLKNNSSIYMPNFPVQNEQRFTELKSFKTNKIVILAALRREKDHLNLMKAFELVYKKHVNWSLHVVGKYCNDDYYSSIKEFIYNKNLEKNVFFYGAVLDTTHVLSQANIGVLSSSSEGLPVALLEYGLAGLPVVVTDVGDCKKVVNDSGWVVSKQDAQKLADAIIEIIEQPVISAKRAQEFQRHIVENYSEKAYFNNLMKIYKSC